MKAKRIFAAALAAAMICASGCGNVEEPETENNGAAAQTGQQTEQPAETQDTEDIFVDDGADDTGENDTTAEEQAQDTQQTQDQTNETEIDEESSDTDLPETDSDSADESDSANRYHNDETGLTVQLPEGTSWKEYDEDFVPWFYDMDDEFRILMETENENDWVFSEMLYRTQKTLDELSNADWDKDVSAEESGDVYTPIENRQLDISGHDSRLLTEKLESSNGVFYRGYVFISMSEGEYLIIRINCQDESVLSQLCSCAENAVFE